MGNIQAIQRIADTLIEGASKEQLAETARILALNVAHFRAQFGEATTADLGAILEEGKVDAAAAGMLASGTEQFVGVLATVMGLDQPNKLN